VDDSIEFDWDDGNTGHIARHGVTPGELEELFMNEPIDLGYEDAVGEPRWTSVGHTGALRVLLVVWTIRGSKIRNITARSASRNLRSQYLKMKGFPL
jgi:uncharacterized DUF497 family protein